MSPFIHKWFEGDRAHRFPGRFSEALKNRRFELVRESLQDSGVKTELQKKGNVDGMETGSDKVRLVEGGDGREGEWESD